MGTRERRARTRRWSSFSRPQIAPQARRDRKCPMEDQERSLRNVATAVYALQAVGVLVPVVLPWIVGVVIDYIKRDEARGTWVESHFTWQIRTFWWSLLWAVIGGILLLVLIGWLVLAATAVWIIYRIVKGWLRLTERREVA